MCVSYALIIRFYGISKDLSNKKIQTCINTYHRVLRRWVSFFFKLVIRTIYNLGMCFVPGSESKAKGWGVIRGLKDEFFHLHKCRASFTSISNSNTLSARVRFKLATRNAFYAFAFSLIDRWLQRLKESASRFREKKKT